MLNAVSNRDVVWIRDKTEPYSPPGNAGKYYLALWDIDQRTWKFANSSGDLDTAPLELQQDLDPTSGHEVRIVTVMVTIEPFAAGAEPFVIADLPLDPRHQRAGSPDYYCHFANGQRPHGLFL